MTYRRAGQRVSTQIDGIPEYPKAELLRRIAKEKALSETLTAEVKAAIDQFKKLGDEV